ncbi:MAG: Maf family protein, partial [Pseudomonadota bacterium]|nr:Maf family protein [Pseudomonadota bacterium]
MSEAQFVLASRSPRRADLLRNVGFKFLIEPADIDESITP